MLRLYPPIWFFPRDPVAEDEILGYHMPAGSACSSLRSSPIATPSWPIRSRSIRRGSRRALRELPAVRVLPVRRRPAQCIGFHLGLLQMQLTAMVAQRFRVQKVPGHPVEYGRMVALRPVHGIRATLQPR